MSPSPNTMRPLPPSKDKKTPPVPLPAANERDFFFEATQQLCSSLRPETAFAHFYAYLARHLPLSFFGLYSMNVGRTETIVVAEATTEGVVSPFSSLKVNHEGESIKKKLRLDDPDSATDYYLTDKNHLILNYLRSFGSRYCQPPLFFMRLVRDGRIIGASLFELGTDADEHQLHMLRGLEAPLCIALSNILELRRVAEARDNVLRDNRRLRRSLNGLTRVDVIGANRGLASVMRTVRQAAPVDVPVLVTGETGAGKEVVAQAIHDLSPRRDKPFIAVNCGALPPALIDSELFGHAKGAFTGAVAERQGYFERADGGTLFLDEVGELPLEAQTRLLRVLETNSVDKVGGRAPLPLDIRLIAATNRNLEDMAEAGRFRSDLFYRLNVVSIRVPPLRERREDIPLLVQHLLEQDAARLGLAVPPLADGEMEKLLEYDWPGNVRELRNALAAALVCCSGGTLCFRLNTKRSINTAKATSPVNPVADDAAISFDALQKQYLEQLLRRTRGRIGGPFGAAALAELNSSTFRFKCRNLGIPIGRERFPA